MAGSSRPTAPTHHACTPTASPVGVLKHCDDPFAVPPRSFRPCPHRCSHCCGVSAGCSLWLCTRPTARTALQVRGDAPSNGPCASRTAQLHARMRQRRLLPELPRDVRRRSVHALCRMGGHGRKVNGVCDPEARGASGVGVSPPQAMPARSRGEGPVAAPLSARPAPCAG